MNETIESPAQEGRLVSDNYRRPGSLSRSRQTETCPSIGEVLGLIARIEAMA